MGSSSITMLVNLRICQLANFRELLVRAIFGVDNTEQGVVNGKTGDARKYAPPHAGWVGISTHMDMHGNLKS